MNDTRVPVRITYDESVSAAYIQLADTIQPGGSARCVPIGVLTLSLDPAFEGGSPGRIGSMIELRFGVPCS